MLEEGIDCTDAGRQVGQGSRRRGTVWADGERDERVGRDAGAAGERRAQARPRASVEGEDVIRGGRIVERPAHDRPQLQHVPLEDRGPDDRGQKLIIGLARELGLDRGRLDRQAGDRIRRGSTADESADDRC